MSAKPFQDALRLSCGTLTIIPVPPPTQVDPTIGRYSMYLAAIPGAALAGFSYLLIWLGVALHLPDLMVGVVVVAGLAWATRALHWDGLADTVDGLGAAFDPTKALAVMRSGDVGPMGVLALVLLVLTQVIAIAALLPNPLLIAASIFASRALLPLVAAAWWRPARTDGLGVTVIGSVPRSAAVLTAGFGLAFGWGLTLASAGLVSALGAVVAALVALIVVPAWVQRRIGGITGDTLGAAVECAATAALVVSCLS